jgi:carbonic anhydrase/acetyltransferase-like protein (isoleucine patch superfamily)
MSEFFPGSLLLSSHPNLDQALFIAANATIIGSVTLSAGVSIWYGAILRGDVEPIVIGEGTNIQDGSILHGDPGEPIILGASVTVGHRVVIHSAEIQRGCLLGIGSIILNGASIGEGSIVGAGAVVTKPVPPRSLVMGIPAKIVREVSDQEAEDLIAHAQRYQILAEHHSQYWKQRADLTL